MKEVGSWDAKAVIDEASAEYRLNVSLARTQKSLHFLSSKLGPLKSLRNMTLRHSNFFSGIGGTRLTYTVTADATFEKASGTMLVTVVNEENEWSLQGWKVNSDKLLE